MIDRLTQRLKETDRTKLLGGLVALLLIGGLAAFAVTRLTDDSLPEGAVFKYGDRVVTEDELDERVKILGALYGVTRPDDKEKGAQFDRDAAKSMAVSLVLQDAVADHDIQVPDRKAQDQLDQLIDDQLVGGRQAFVDWLAQSGISEQDVLDEISDQLATSMLVEEVVGDTDVSEDAVRTAYEEHKADMVTPEVRHLLNIVVQTKQDAQRVAQAARSGADFGRIASTWSLDGSTRDKGGDLGEVTADQLEPAYAKAAFAVPRGSVYGPVQTQYGWNVGKVVAVKAPTALSFAAVKDRLTETLRTKERLDAWREYLGDLLENADVQYADDYRPEDPTAPPSDVTPSTTAGD